MMTFVAGVAALLCLALGILLLRRGDAPRSADVDDPNLGWYRQRASELATDDPRLLEDARLRLLEDSQSGQNTGAALPAGRFSRVALGVVVLGVSALVYWQTGAIEDVLIYEQLASIKPEDGEVKRTALLQRIEARSAAREDNLQYLGLLGQLYMAAENYAGASDSFGRLAIKAPEDSQALALAAQARFLASGRQLDPQAQQMAEQALAINPEQSAALGLLGMASFERGDFAAAVRYWERLQAQEAPESQAYKMLGEVMAVARERGGLESVAGTDPVTPAGGPGISVAISLPEGLQADPAATVFVFARSAGAAGGMPIAVRRLRAADLPVTLRLSDSDAMAGQRLSEAGAVLVSAQLSANGQPGTANAVYSGVAGPVAAGGAEVAVAIELRDAAQSG